MRFTVSLALLGLASTALAVPAQLHHSGRVMDSSGQPLGGPQIVEVALFNDPVAGSLVWSEQASIDFDNGYFDVLLGSDTVNNPLSVSDLDQPALYVELSINGAPVGRQRVVSVPYAMLAGTAVNVDGGSVNATEIRVNGSVVIDSSGGLVGGATLQGLSCVTDQIAVFNGSTWTCTDTPSWSSLAGVPPELTDGDADTLGALSCSDTQVAAYAAGTGTWGCVSVGDWAALRNVPIGFLDGTDDVLDEAAVDLYTSNNGYALDATLDPIAKSGQWLDLRGVPAGFTDGVDDDTQLDEATVDAMVGNNGYALDAAIATVGKTGAWADLSGVPAGFLDGIDDDTQLDEATVDAMVGNNGYALDADINVVGKTGSWNDLVSVPGGFADGIDNDTIYTDADAVAAVATADTYVQNTGDVVSGQLDVQTLVVGDDGSSCASGANVGKIRWSGTAFQGCDGTKWRDLEMHDPRPVLKQSAASYTIAEVRAFGGSWPAQGGAGNVCEADYHICTYIEAVAVKHSRLPIQTAGDLYLRTAGSYSSNAYIGINHPHNGLLGYDAGGNWNGPGLRCPVNSAPMLYFYSNANLAKSIEWDGGCYADDSRPWACCLNRSED